jgi:branched-chain amino acid transport system ATP-binding protein
MTENMLHVDNVTKYFGGLAAVNNLSFTLAKREILGIIGPNGAGKTTMFNCITGFLKPNSGRILFEGRDIGGIKPYLINRAGIARTFQIVKPFADLSVFKNVLAAAFTNSEYSKKEATEQAYVAIEKVGLSDRGEMLASSLTLSSKKRMELARALATNPKLLMLDEVMAGLNQKETGLLIELIMQLRSEGITFIVIEHIMKVVMNISDRIVVMNEGEKIAEGLPDDISNNQLVIDAYLGETYREGEVGA